MEIIMKYLKTFIMLSLMTLLLNSCEKSITYQTTHSYLYPNYTSTHKIIALKLYDTYRNRDTRITLANYQSELVIMDLDGQNEAVLIPHIYTDLFSISATCKYIAYKTCTSNTAENSANINDSNTSINTPSTIQIWDVAQGQVISEIKTKSRAISLDWSSDDTQLAILQNNPVPTNSYYISIYQAPGSFVTSFNINCQQNSSLSWKHHDYICYVAQNTFHFCTPANNYACLNSNVSASYPYSFDQTNNYLLYMTDQSLQKLKLSDYGSTKIADISYQEMLVAAINKDATNCLLTWHKDYGWGLYNYHLSTQEITKLCINQQP
jgi:hypothetical protein